MGGNRRVETEETITMAETLERLTILAYAYAPFFFAVWFTQFVTRWTYRIYAEAPSQEHQRINRWVFVGACTVSTLMVFGSIGWWVLYRPDVHVFRGQITGLSDEDRLGSNSVCFLPLKPYFPSLGQEAIDVPRVENFIVVSDKPFRKNQRFDFHLTFGAGDVHDLSLEYTSDPNVEHRIEWHNQKPSLVRGKGGSSSLNLLNVAHAADRIAQNSADSAAPRGPTFGSAPRALIEALQSERADVGTKIAYLEQMRMADDNTVGAFLKHETQVEPMLLTVLDLSRHSNPLLADKAKSLVDERFNLVAHLERELKSSDRSRRDSAIMLMLRMEPSRVVALVKELPQHLVAPYESLLSDRNQYQVLVPTASRQGDRYYVQASWEPASTQTVSCLTGLFNRELISDRTLDEEEELMRGRSRRWVYWYSKDWAMYIANGIRDCGARASFVSGESFR